MIRSQRTHVSRGQALALQQAIQLTLFGSPEPFFTQVNTPCFKGHCETDTAVSTEILVPRIETTGVTGSILNQNNARFTPDMFTRRGDVGRIRANIEAIRLAKTITVENRPATKEEKSVLAQYTGWGGLSAVFEQYADSQPEDMPNASKYNVYRRALENLLTAEELENAQLSTLNAFYTTPEIITAMWQAVEGFGFTGGRILEPSAGIGHFYGLMPEAIRQASPLVAVEKDYGAPHI